MLDQSCYCPECERLSRENASLQEKVGRLREALTTLAFHAGEAWKQLPGPEYGKTDHFAQAIKQARTALEGGENK